MDSQKTASELNGFVWDLIGSGRLPSRQASNKLLQFRVAQVLSNLQLFPGMSEVHLDWRSEGLWAVVGAEDDLLEHVDLLLLSVSRLCVVAHRR